MKQSTPWSSHDALTDPCGSGDPVRLMSHFYQHVVTIKQGLESGELEDDISQQLKLNRTPSDEELADAIANRLQRWIERCAKQLRKQLTEREYRLVFEAMFVMVALVDELLIFNIDWRGRHIWQNTPLEVRIFRSSYAGERFFAGVARLLKQRSWDSQQQNLAAVYLFAMRLGFCGCFRDQPKKLQHVRLQLYKRISTSGQLQQLCPGAYQNVLSASEEKRLAPLGAWYRLMALGLITYLGVSWGIWLAVKGTWL
ncbi:hypothetical protein CHH28_14610 [Bacterioplanes sanyensis]|uniref:Type IV / VI secretion system DotU domain-containing protein n=1 Tax=Bacterioplanes sanyensis TaxID=1249553 RepID=A0A222FM45_9GAMM|nr:DotU family type IV/VI secretion system protein [Bacterioplanes sanyensis]ASP39829.1 hypothetical protein CHH28_14610 [Bacterioplanes sanyensis]